MLELAGDGLFNFVCEIPKESAAKMEVATVSGQEWAIFGWKADSPWCQCFPRPQDETNTPIKQDTKKGKLRFYPYNINW